MTEVSNSQFSTRKQNDNFNNCNILIFGYSSKLFRDDEKAVQIDQGTHLIPWIGDENILIDRYDVRGYFSDVSHYEVSEDYNYILSDEEKQVEQLCDNERYSSLFHNDEEQDMYKEEELKRSKDSSKNQYGQVSYQYSDYEPNSKNPRKCSPTRDIEESFTPSPILNVPLNIVLPTTSNLNQIIEKTADCVIKNGLQMEIIIKTRQAKNEKFSFLNKENVLHPYYQFILNAMKEGIYKSGNETHDGTDKEEEFQSKLQFTPLYNVESAPIVSDVDFNQTQDCPYNMLVSKIHRIKEVDDVTQQTCSKFQLSTL